MNTIERFKRYVVFLLGLFFCAFGISFVTKASLGTSPISSITYTLSLAYTPTLGQFTLYMSIVLIILQLLMLRKAFPKEYLLQIPLSFLFSYFIDLTMQLLAAIALHTYLAKVLFLLIGCVILGVGIFLEVLADVVMLPGESFVKVVSDTFHTDFGHTKVAFDSSMTIIATIMGLLLLHKLAGVREGTVVASVLIGSTARFCIQRFGFVRTYLFQPLHHPKKPCPQTDRVSL